MRVFQLVLFLALFGFASARPTTETSLDSLLNEEWKRLMDVQPLMALYLGEKSANLWPTPSAGSRRAEAEHYRQVIARLQKLSERNLSMKDAINLRLFREQLEWLIERHENDLDLFIMNQREGLHTAATMAGSIAFDQLADFQRWVERLESFGAYADGELATLREAVTKDRVHPRIITERMIEVVAVQPLLHQDPLKSPFFEPFLQGEEKFREDPRFLELKERAKRAISSEIRPAFVRLLEFLRGPYLEASPSEIGLNRLRGGEKAYRFLIRRYTTTDLSADEIHQIGLSEVARIRGAMERIKLEVGFEGSLEEFFTSLRSDPKHYTNDPRELLRRYRAFCKTVDGQMPNFFKTLPRKPYGVIPIPDYVAPATTTAYYMPGAGHLAGNYCVNLFRPETRALFEIPALSLHESVPGHHHQIALAEELSNLPAFRKRSDGFGDYTVFVE